MLIRGSDDSRVWRADVDAPDLVRRAPAPLRLVPPILVAAMSISAPLAPMPPAHLLLGHLHERTHSPLDLFLSSQQSLGDVVRYRMGYVYVDQLTHPDHVQHVLVGSGGLYPKGSIWDKMRPFVGVGC